MKRLWQFAFVLAALTVTSFGHELVFPWYPGLDGCLIIWRTDDWRNYLEIKRVPFEDQGNRFTNSFGKVFTRIQFTDSYPLPYAAFYEGVIITNMPGVLRSKL